MIDSGATTHATSQRDLFSTYTTGNYGSVKMGNDAMAQVAGIGDVCLRLVLVLGWCLMMLSMFLILG